MKITKQIISDTETHLQIAAEMLDLENFKTDVVKDLTKDLKIPGFRPGKAPQSIAERSLDSTKLQNQFLETAVNALFKQALETEKLMPIDQPKITINKFVPYSDLEFKAEIKTLGKVKLGNYKNVKLSSPPTEITEDEINRALDQLLSREAKKQVVSRASKKGDEVEIDFEGFDSKTNKHIPGTHSKKYPIVLGSDTFIPGFENHLIGSKAGQDLEFNITFPADYTLKSLQKRRVKFIVKILEVRSVEKPVLDDKLAAKFGPFKSVAELMADIKKELSAEKQRLANQTRHNELVAKVVESSSVTIPENIIDNQVEFNIKNEQRRLIQQGRTWTEYLETEALTEDEFRKANRTMAEQQVKTGLVLGEIALVEKIQVTPDEIEVQINMLKQQYSDPNVRAELDKPEVRQDLTDRIMVEKIIERMMSYQSPKVS